MRPEEEHNVVIVGGGISGLATALALYRKGISSLVLEKSSTLRTTGAAIGVYINGWRALDQLGVGLELRTKSLPLSEIRTIRLQSSNGKVTPCSKEALRCLKRSDLVETLAANLPVESVHFGCHVVSVGKDPVTSLPIIYVKGGDIIKAKVLIGCDGSNSIIAKSLGLQPARLFPVCVVRGFTTYPNDHSFGSSFLRQIGASAVVGRIPIDDKLVHWFVGQLYPPKDQELEKDPQMIRDLVIKQVKNFPEEIVEMVQQCDPSSLSFTHIRSRTPRHLLFGNYWKATTTIAGDAMHVMCPFLGQGGSAGLEDAIVLARCLAQELHACLVGGVSHQQLQRRVGMALNKYVKERRPRVLRLCTQSYLTGLVITTPSLVKRVASLLILVAFFGGFSLSHTQYDCGHL